VQAGRPGSKRRAPRVNVVKKLSAVVWVGWQIRPGATYFGLTQRADGTVERTRLNRDDLQAAAHFVTVQMSQTVAPIRARKLQRLT
jgi:hypothetical protein